MQVNDSRGATTQASKRSSSVKNSSSSNAYRVGNEQSNMNYYSMSRKHGVSSQNGYSNIAAYDQQNNSGQSHSRRDRGNSAQPLTGAYNQNQINSNQLVISNLNQRSSSTTNKSKKTSQSMAANL